MLFWKSQMFTRSDMRETSRHSVGRRICGFELRPPGRPWPALTTEVKHYWSATIHYSPSVSTGPLPTTYVTDTLVNGVSTFLTCPKCLCIIGVYISLFNSLVARRHERTAARQETSAEELEELSQHGKAKASHHSIDVEKKRRVEKGSG